MKKLLFVCAIAGAIATVAAPVLVLISDDAAAQSRWSTKPNSCWKNGKRTTC
jgi:hypothetical protein